MVLRTGKTLHELYTDDETAWLDAMADLIAAGAHGELDYQNLQELLTDMAERERREVESRLVVLILHVLKWVHQPENRSASWRGSVVEQRQELEILAGRGVLRNHAEAALPAAYGRAAERAAAETGLPATAFPPTCAYSVDDLLAFRPEADNA